MRLRLGLRLRARIVGEVEVEGEGAGEGGGWDEGEGEGHHHGVVGERHKNQIARCGDDIYEEHIVGGVDAVRLGRETAIIGVDP